MDKKTLEQLNQINKGTMMEQIGIEYVDVGEGYIKAIMPVDERTFQPDKILHGGASLALAETVAGFGSAFMVNLDEYNVRGAQVSANHIGAAKSGFVIAEGKLIHQGKYTHLWNVDIKTEEGKPVSVCRITNLVVKK